MAPALRSRKLQMVIKISKHCNLRCSYCYEYPYLSHKGYMSVEQIERLIGNIVDYQFDPEAPSAGEDGVEFIWHGGEPFLVPIEHYEAIATVQKKFFGSKKYENAIQTNLTILTDRHLEWLKQGSFFGSGRIGFSCDLYGDQRVDLKGAPTTPKVLEHLNRLLESDVATGAITVLSQSTLPYVKNIFGFYDDLGMDFRLLPYHLETDARQTTLNGITPNEIVAAMCEAFDLWRGSDNPVVIAPLSDYIEYAIAFINDIRNCYYDKSVNESIFVVDTNGDVYGTEIYSANLCYGNLFEQKFADMLASPARSHLVAESRSRVERYCSKCKFFGYCPGFAVGDANEMESQWLAAEGCYVEKIIAHIVEQLNAAGLGRLPATPVAKVSSVAL